MQAVDHPPHYNNHPSKIECNEVTRYMNFDLGNAFKYLFRAESKNGKQDYRKAIWYLNDEIAFREDWYAPATFDKRHLVDRIADADHRPEIAKAMRHIAKAAFQHSGTSDLECAIQEIEKWLSGRA
jgi:hypothetical protein